MTSGAAPAPDAQTNPPVRLTIPLYEEITRDLSFKMGLWRDEANCLKMTAEHPEKYQRTDWFPETTPGRRLTRVPPHVKAACEECPVRLECLSFAILIEAPDGIWAGHLPRTIHKYIRKVKRSRP